MATKKAAKKAASKTTKKKATKKAAPKKKASSEALVKDLAAVLTAHKWTGKAVVFAAAASPCPDGKTPVELHFEDADGNQITRTVCV